MSYLAAFPTPRSPGTFCNELAVGTAAFVLDEVVFFPPFCFLLIVYSRGVKDLARRALIFGLPGWLEHAVLTVRIQDQLKLVLHAVQVLKQGRGSLGPVWPVDWPCTTSALQD